MTPSPDLKVTATTDPHELVPLCTCTDQDEAAVVRSVLEAAEIFCVGQAEHHRAMLGVLGAYISPVVLVRAGDVERAKAVFADENSHGASPATEPSADSEPESSLAPPSSQEDAETRARRTRRRRAGAWIFLVSWNRKGERAGSLCDLVRQCPTNIPARRSL